MFLKQSKGFRTTTENVLKAEQRIQDHQGKCSKSGVRRSRSVQRSAIRGRCAHGCACCLQISAPAIADDVIGWQRWRGSSSSSRGDSEFAVYDKVEYSSSDSRPLCSSLCLLLASERLGSAVYLCEWHKRHHGSSSRGGNLEFAACNKLEVAFGARAMGSLSCSRLADKHTGNRR